MIVASFTVQVGERSAQTTLAIPADILLGQLGAANPVVALVDASELLLAQVSHVPVEVSLQFPEKSVAPGRHPGPRGRRPDPSGHAGHKPLDIAVDGHSLARAAVGATGARLACVITDIQEKN